MAFLIPLGLLFFGGATTAGVGMGAGYLIGKKQKPNDE